MASSTVDQHLGEWLEAATIETSAEQHNQWRKAVTVMSKALDANLCLQITAAAYAEVSDPARAWMNDRLREQDPAFAPSGKDFLLATLAGAVVIETLDTPAHPRRALASLLVDSAPCTLLSPRVPSLSSTSNRVGAEIRRTVRERSLDQTQIFKEINEQLDAVPQVDPAVPDLATTVGLVVVQDLAIRGIAKRLFEMNQQLASLLSLQEEELDTLWWSYGGLSTTLGEAWDKVVPVERRVVLASVELRRLLTIVPSPTSSRALLARALGKAASSQTTLAQVAEATVEFLEDVSGLPEHRLLPIASAARQRQKIGGDDDTWKTVISRTIGYDPDTAISTLDAAEQVLRELDMRAFF